MRMDPRMTSARLRARWFGELGIFALFLRADRLRLTSLMSALTVMPLSFCYLATRVAPLSGDAQQTAVAGAMALGLSILTLQIGRAALDDRIKGRLNLLDTLALTRTHYLVARIAVSLLESAIMIVTCASILRIAGYETASLPWVLVGFAVTVPSSFALATWSCVLAHRISSLEMSWFVAGFVPPLAGAATIGLYRAEGAPAILATLSPFASVLPGLDCLFGNVNDYPISLPLSCAAPTVWAMLGVRAMPWAR